MATVDLRLLIVRFQVLLIRCACLDGHTRTASECVAVAPREGNITH